jgi:hypothetical protein
MKLQLVGLKPLVAAVVRGRNVDDPKKRKSNVEIREAEEPKLSGFGRTLPNRLDGSSAKKFTRHDVFC